jgi:hypothetical protein
VIYGHLELRIGRSTWGVELGGASTTWRELWKLETTAVDCPSNALKRSSLSHEREIRDIWGLLGRTEVEEVEKMPVILARIVLGLSLAVTRAVFEGCTGSRGASARRFRGLYCTGVCNMRCCEGWRGSGRSRKGFEVCVTRRG